MSNIINPVLPVGGAELSVDHAKGVERSGNTFSDHLDRRLDNDQQKDQDKLGVRHSEKKQEAVKNENASDDEVKKANPEHEAVPVEEQGEVVTLVHFLQDIQQVAQEKNLGPGEWAVALPEPEILADLAQQAGMSEADFNALVEQFQADNGEIDLGAFFQSLIDHFRAFEENPAVVVPETEFPMLEGLLAKLGLSPAQLEQISNQVVVNDGEIDLALLAQALKELDVTKLNPVVQTQDDGQAALVLNEESGKQSAQVITLSSWEAEQLQGLMEQAGVPLEKQLELMPEQVFGEEVVLSLERLQSLLKETVAQVQQDQPKLDLPQFLGSLEKVMKQAAFQDQSVGFTPVVQESLGDAYKDLLEMYDKARLRFEEGLDTEEEQLQKDIQKWLDGVVTRAAEARTGHGAGGDQEEQGFFENNSLSAGPFAPVDGDEFTYRQDGMSSGQVAGDQVTAQASDQPQPVRHFPPHQQQQIMNQLSLAVSRGLKSGEQNLVLRLFPAELGEVKVDLSVRNEVVSVSFTMENSKVKETLEGSMDDFRNNMEQKGFSLNEVNVYVGEKGEDHDSWQRFEMALNGEKLQAQNLEDIPDDVLYHTVNSEQYASQEEGVNLFV